MATYTKLKPPLQQPARNRSNLSIQTQGSGSSFHHLGGGIMDHVGHNFSPKNHTLLPGCIVFGVKNRTSGFNPSSVKFLEN